MLQNKILKRSLVIFLLAVLTASLFYTFSLFTEVKTREAENAKIWIHTVEQQRKLISELQVLFEGLEYEEEKKLRLWAKAVKRLPQISNVDADFNIVFDLVRNNETIPAILTDLSGNILYHRNTNGDSIENLERQLSVMRRTYKPIQLDLPDGSTNLLFFGESQIHQDISCVFDDLLNSYLHDIEHNIVSAPVLYMDSAQTEVLAYGNLDKLNTPNRQALSNEEKIAYIQTSTSPLYVGEEVLFLKETNLLFKIKFFPIVFLILVSGFALVFYFYLKTSERFEQNTLWVGMSKETAHQLGTPISSLMAWNEVLKDEFESNQAFNEIQKDIDRLELIADRFSKIGSIPKLETCDLEEEVRTVVSYMRPRISPHVDIQVSSLGNAIPVALNHQLMSWVVENLMKNAVDAMSGKGSLDIKLFCQEDRAIVEVTDTGVGIKKSRFRKIFRAGYSSKKRGWGLGLALVKRIVEEYHNGKIYVKESVEGKGATIRMEFHLKTS